LLGGGECLKEEREDARVLHPRAPGLSPGERVMVPDSRRQHRRAAGFDPDSARYGFPACGAASVALWPNPMRQRRH
jgi:hypothetical protein